MDKEVFPLTAEAFTHVETIDKVKKMYTSMDDDARTSFRKSSLNNLINTMIGAMKVNEQKKYSPKRSNICQVIESLFQTDHPTNDINTKINIINDNIKQLLRNQMEPTKPTFPDPSYTSPFTLTPEDNPILPIANQNNHISTSEKRPRDRFVFRAIHQDILNEAFYRNPYPENDDKETLVDKCNEALEKVKNRPLRENERMTILNITNWFNNRRKEKKKKGYMEVTVPPALQHATFSDDQIITNHRVKEEIISEQEDNI